MYKIQNVMSGNLSLDLERGSITLRSGQSYDLEVACSRKWLRANALLKRLVAAQHIRLVHDSEAVIPVQPVRRARPTIAPPPVVEVVTTPVTVVQPHKEKPVAPAIIDLSSKVDPTPAASQPVAAVARVTEEKKVEVVDTKLPDKKKKGKDEVAYSKTVKKDGKHSFFKKDKDDSEDA